MIARIFFLALCLLQFVFAQSNKLIPPGDKISDSELRIFLLELEVAVLKKDKAFIIDHLSAQVQNGFGGDPGIEGFKNMWNWDAGAKFFWPSMARILDLGGGIYDGSNSYAISYVYSEWPEDADYDVFEHGAITGSRVNVRSKPNLTNSTVQGQFTYDIVKVDYGKSWAPPTEEDEKDYPGSFQWYYVEDVDSQLSGYVYWKYFRSPLELRVGFIKQNGIWQISYLVEGD